MVSEWKNSVYIRIGTGSVETITGAGDAFAALNTRWPGEHGPHYNVAKRICGMAAAGDISSEVAREAFIAAALEASVLDERVR
jgi:hypothetical protein